ncbi:MAG: serine hydroxymethyltransferase [Bdellovibrionales bacterium]
MNAKTPREVLFEYVPAGNSMRVTAVDADSGMEVVVQAPLSLSQADMQKLAMNKLVYVMGKRK